MKDECFLISSIIQIWACLDGGHWAFNNGLHGPLAAARVCALGGRTGDVCFSARGSAQTRGRVLYVSADKYIWCHGAHSSARVLGKCVLKARTHVSRQITRPSSTDKLQIKKERTRFGVNVWRESACVCMFAA